MATGIKLFWAPPCQHWHLLMMPANHVTCPAMCMLQSWFRANSLEVTMPQLAVLAPAKGVDLPLDIDTGAVTPATRYNVHLLALNALHLARQIPAEGAAEKG